MNKILVFTNKTSWHCIKRTIRQRVDWENAYPNDKNLITLCTTNQTGDLVLQSVDELYEEGVYLVFDEIDYESLRLLLDPCPNDIYYILVHSRPDVNNFAVWGERSVVIRGRHENNLNDKYYPLFNILTDDNTDKTNRIIKSVFMETVKSNFLSGCRFPNNNNNQFRLACRILCENPNLKKDMTEFLSLYEHCHNRNEYLELYNKLKENLEEVI